MTLVLDADARLQKYQVWVDECAKMFGGMEMIALDILHTADGRDVLLELNGTCCLHSIDVD